MLAIGLPVAVAAIVAVTLLLCYVGRPKRRAHITRCGSSVKQIMYACHLYSSENDEAFPPSLGTLFPTYLTDGKVFLCPRARRGTKTLEVADLPGGAADASAVLTHEYTDYVYVSGPSAADPARCVIVFDRLGNHEDGRCVGFAGGNVKWMKEREFQDALARTIEYLSTRDAGVFEALEDKK